MGAIYYILKGQDWTYIHTYMTMCNEGQAQTYERTVNLLSCQLIKNKKLCQMIFF